MNRHKVQWKAFSIDELFDICTGRDIIIGTTKDGNIPLISHQNTDNGIVKRIKRMSNRKLFNHKSTIALADRGVFWAFVQDEDFQIGTRVKALSLKSGETSKEVLLFIATAINKLQVMFKEYLVNATDKLPELEIMLPVNSGKIDYAYMQERIKELEQERIKELEQYLIETKLNDYSLDKIDKEIENSKHFFGTFKIPDLFEVKNTNCILQSQIVPNSGKIPYVTAGESNNSISTYISCSHEWIDEGNCVFIGGKTMTVSYQSTDFCSNDSHNLALYLRNTQNRKPNIQKYLVAAIKKSLISKYTWNDSVSNKKIKHDVVSLPLKNTSDAKDYCLEDIDWDYMEKYIRVIEKKVVADVVKYKDQVIDVARKVVNG